MAEDPRTYQPSTPQANRASLQGLGAGQRDMDAQRDPNRDQHATDPNRTEGWDNDPAGRGDDRGQGSSDMGAGAVSAGTRGESRSFDSASTEPERNAAGLDDTEGDLGEGTPANVAAPDLGDGDNPEEDWGGSADEGATFSSNRTNRGGRTELERGQGAKTRAANKDIVSRRS